MTIRPLSAYILLRILPRRNEVTSYQIVDGKFVNTSDTDLDSRSVAIVSDGAYSGHPDSWDMLDAEVMATGKRCKRVNAGERVCVGRFCGIEVDDDSARMTRMARESEIIGIYVSAA